MVEDEIFTPYHLTVFAQRDKICEGHLLWRVFLHGRPRLCLISCNMEICYLFQDTVQSCLMLYLLFKTSERAVALNTITTGLFLLPFFLHFIAFRLIKVIVNHITVEFFLAFVSLLTHKPILLSGLSGQEQLNFASLTLSWAQALTLHLNSLCFELLGSNYTGKHYSCTRPNLIFN